MAQPAVRYDSPTWNGFRFETSYGTAGLVNAILDTDSYRGNSGGGLLPHPADTDSKFWDFAAIYNEDWGNFRVSAAYAYTWLEASPLNGAEQDIHQVGGTLMHVPTGLGVYALPVTGRWLATPITASALVTTAFRTVLLATVFPIRIAGA